MSNLKLLILVMIQRRRLHLITRSHQFCKSNAFLNDGAISLSVCMHGCVYAWMCVCTHTHIPLHLCKIGKYYHFFMCLCSLWKYINLIRMQQATYMVIVIQDTFVNRMTCGSIQPWCQKSKFRHPQNKLEDHKFQSFQPLIVIRDENSGYCDINTSGGC